ncbi:hypothetical protein PPL_03611 [Heterostelium album PN500]|uniref:Uncharacterized protein n=1 Tax=Heterostelium pallidum (strain ATCC 26659 / Pp 5 / PN500) TaxID=670386 RepID=D3B598_HETP5|nr:hypothetical protein PPL_03611 [Heterostelium album PN500]EFA83463.1 hypothetical protein PPL_03611 [Heterostelium album PN500]|eukprot:XP_020435580.1 hypothetical protein PPL_03611 [Heterostelium album PN500]
MASENLSKDKAYENLHNQFTAIQLELVRQRKENIKIQSKFYFVTSTLILIIAILICFHLYYLFPSELNAALIKELKSLKDEAKTSLYSLDDFKSRVNAMNTTIKALTEEKERLSRENGQLKDSIGKEFSTLVTSGDEHATERLKQIISMSNSIDDIAHQLKEAESSDRYQKENELMLAELNAFKQECENLLKQKSYLLQLLEDKEDQLELYFLTVARSIKLQIANLGWECNLNIYDLYETAINTPKLSFEEWPIYFQNLIYITSRIDISRRITGYPLTFLISRLEDKIHSQSSLILPAISFLKSKHSKNNGIINLIVDSNIDKSFSSSRRSSPTMENLQQSIIMDRIWHAKTYRASRTDKVKRSKDLRTYQVSRSRTIET